MELLVIVIIVISAYGLTKYIPSWLDKRARLINLRKHSDNLKKIGLPYISEHDSPVMADALKKNLDSAAEKNETEAKLIESLYLLHHFIFKSACMKCIRPHAKTLARKKKSSIYKDDYGREIRDTWTKEVQYFTERILIPFIKKESLENQAIDLEASNDYINYVYHYSSRDIEFYIEIIEDALEKLFDDEEQEDIPDNGHDYERYVADIFNSYGYSARVTKGSGDHGADIIVNNGEFDIVVQCKHYSSPVGNKAVQEAYSAKDFYDADQAWVVASNSFTPSAKIAAQKLGVWLVHHEDLPEFLETMDSRSLLKS